MRRRRRLAEIRDALRKNWRVQPHCYQADELVGGLVVRQLEERRVLTISPAVALALAAAGGEADIAQGIVTNPDPATPLGTDAAHHEPIDPGERTVQGEATSGQSQHDDTDGPAAENLEQSDNASVADPESVQTAVASNVEAEQTGLTLDVVVDPQTPIAEGSELSLSGEFTDTTFEEDASHLADDETLEYRYSINWGDGHVDADLLATIDPDSEGEEVQGSFEAAHTYADNGVYTVSVTLTGPSGQTASSSVLVIVNNVAPVLDPIDDVTVTEGQELTTTFHFVDPGFDNSANPEGELTERFTYSINWGDSPAVESGPPTITVEGSEGVMTEGVFQGAHTYADNGTYTVTVTIVDDDGGRDVQTFQVTVNNVAPVLEPVDTQIFDEGETFTIPFEFSDLGFGSTETFTYTINWGDDSEAVPLPQPVENVVPGSPGVATVGTFDGTHTYADNGVYNVIVTVFDDNGGVGQLNVLVIVNNVAPVLDPIDDVTVNEGQELTTTFHFADPGYDNPRNPEGELTERFTYSINWGDSPAVESGPPTITVEGSEGVMTEGMFQGTHTYADNGTYTVTVTIVDDDGGRDVQTFEVTVNNVAPVLEPVDTQIFDEGETFTIPFEFSDLGFGSTETFTYTINWGDDSEAVPIPQPVENVVPGSGGVATVGMFDGTHTYADNGVYNVTVTVFDDNGGVGQLNVLVIVNNVAPTLVVPGDQMIEEGALLSIDDIGQFSDPGYDNPLNIEGETVERFTFAIDWGDGSGLDSGPGPIEVFGSMGVPTSGSFAGSHVYTVSGVYTVTVTISDDDGGRDVKTFKVTVKDVTPILIAAEDQTVNEGALLSVIDIGQFIDPRAGGAESYMFTINWGDGLPGNSGEPTIDSPGGEGPVSGSFNGAHIYADNGVYTVVVTLFAADGRSASDTMTVTVNNVAPTLVVPGPQTVALGTTLSINDVGQFTDPGFDNPFNVEGETTERFTFAVNWGDGQLLSSGPGTIDSPGSAGVLTAGSFNGQHVFGSAGTFTATVTVSDDDGGSATGQFTIIVFVIKGPPPSIFVPGGAGGGASPPPSVFLNAQVKLIAPASVTRFDPSRAGIVSVAGAEPRLVLRVVSPAGIEDKANDEPLADEVLDSLRSLFRRLPDGHYRIYRIEPDGVEWLVVDVIVRQGRNIDVADEAAGTATEAPKIDDAKQPEPADAVPATDPTLPPAGAAVPDNDLPRDEASDKQSTDTHTSLPAAAVGLAGGSVAYAAPLGRRRLRRTLKRHDPSPPTKARRLLRRLRKD